MKVQRLIVLDYELSVMLKEVNASALINGLLIKHFNKSKQTEAEILAEVEDKINEQDQEEAEVKNKEERSEYLDNMDEEKTIKYKEGLKEGKWKGLVEFAKIQLKDGSK